jgi:hypothetical protein
VNTINKNSKIYAPIVLIAFNRPEHTKKTISALVQNIGAKDSDLYCFIDGARNAKDVGIQKTIVDIVNDHLKDFKSISIIQREVNFGLAKNIIQAVTEVVSIHGKVIVLEDDIVTSDAFLIFMNDALDFYEYEDKVWHIASHSGVNFEQRKDEIFLWRLMNCWGWATWQDRWQYFEKDADLLMNEFTEQMIQEFDINGSGLFWSQIVANAQNKINTWAIFWYATIFKNGGLCVNPYFSYAANIGFDGSGVHCGADERRMVKQSLNHDGKFIGKTEIVEDLEAFNIMRKAYMPKKGIRYYALKLVTIFVSKERLKKLLMKS